MITEKDTEFYYRDMLQAMACQLDYEFNNCPLDNPHREKSITKLEDFIINPKSQISMSKFFFEVGRSAYYTDSKFHSGKFDKTNYQFYKEALNKFQKFTGVEEI